MRKLAMNAEFQAAALPARIASLMLSRYQPGMAYGQHTDNPLFDSGRIRGDIAMTLFLLDPEGYDGGELEISMGSGADNVLRYRLAAGSMILYPAHYFHNVTEILSGTRLAVISWVQSLVHDPLQRQILFDLTIARKNLRAKDDASPDLPHLERASSSLFRMWAEN